MKRAISLTLLLMLAHATAWGEAPQVLTRSAEGLASEDPTLLEQRLEQAPVITAQPRTESTVTGLAARDCGCFELFDAWASQTRDDDGDGYHHRISVEFDADTASARETVYAKLYLRRDYGPWTLYSETGLFDIRYDEAADRYRIDTDLLEGFPPGRYDLMIDLHALYHTGIVASRVVSFDARGDLLYLEDEQHDTPPTEVVIVTPPVDEIVIIEDDPYAGALTPGGLLAMGLLGWLRRRTRIKGSAA